MSKSRKEAVIAAEKRLSDALDHVRADLFKSEVFADLAATELALAKYAKPKDVPGNQVSDHAFVVARTVFLRARKERLAPLVDEEFERLFDVHADRAGIAKTERETARGSLGFDHAPPSHQ